MEPLPPLEEWITLPTGQRARRCQHTRPDGTQCGAPAKKGELYCRAHLKRLEEPSPQPPSVPDPAKEAAREALEAAPPSRGGRPPSHGLRTDAGRRAIRELAEEILRLEADLDNTDRELAVLKATLLWLLEKAQEYQEKAEKLGALIGSLSTVTGDDPQTLRLLAEDLRLANRLQAELASWVDRLMDSAMRVVSAVKQRAETRAKLAEAKALEAYAKLILKTREILWDLLSEETLDLFEERLAREVLAPAGIELPARLRN